MKPMFHTPTTPPPEVLDTIRKEFTYDPETGIVMRTTAHTGARQLKSSTVIRYAGRKIKVKPHHIGWFLTEGEWPSMPIDHIDRNDKNTRRANLRLATPQENTWNRGKVSVSTNSKYRGVIWKPESRQWLAQITCDGEHYRLGNFDSEDEAARAYDDKATELFGEFANLNFKPRPIGPDTPVIEYQPVPRETRFWTKVKKGNDDECWEWQAGKTSQGYGSFNYGVKGKTVPQKAHQYSYELAYGSIPEGLFVLHSCDNKACVNPKHLRAGTHKDNMQDLSKRGPANPQPRYEGTRYLTRKEEKAIKARLTNGDSLSAITRDYRAQGYRVSRAGVRAIRNGTWAPKCQE